MAHPPPLPPGKILTIRFFLIPITIPFIIGFDTSMAQMAPALFVFGDSLVDVGNNNYLEFSLVKANFPHNGIDFPTRKATGRFSNGKNAADFIAQRLGLPSPPPYLSMAHNDTNLFLTGVSFASGGAGILDGINSQLLEQSMSMSKQIGCLAKIRTQMAQRLGGSATESIFSKALFVIVIGSNDILGHINGNSNTTARAATAQEQLVDSMIGNLTAQIQRMYDLGARKFGVIGVGPVGCCPSRRRDEAPWECDAKANQCAFRFNQRLLSLLEGQFNSKLDGFKFSFLDTYNILLDFIQNPTTHGFEEVNAACCGLGPLRAKAPCLPFSSYCANRSNHIFWDFYHPTEATARRVIQISFDGPSSYSVPVTLSQLFAST